MCLPKNKLLSLGKRIVLFWGALVIGGCLYLEKIPLNTDGFTAAKDKISTAERNRLVKALITHEWQAVNKYNIPTWYSFRVDDNGLLISFLRDDNQSPEYYLKESNRGFQLDLAGINSYLRFEITPNRQPIVIEKKGAVFTPTDTYRLIPIRKKVIVAD